MEKQSEQHATTPSERTSSREKGGLGTSPCANAYLAYRLYELDKGEYATPGHPIKQSSSAGEKSNDRKAERQPVSLPSNLEVNPRQEGNEHVKAITLRSGRELAIQGQPLVIGEVETEEVIQTSQNDNTEREQPQEKKFGGEETEVKDHQPIAPILYPQRLKKNKLDKQFTKFMEVFKKLHINIPFADALEQMPSYVKFMKDILSQKRRLSDFKTVNLTEECSAILQRKLLQKLKDPGSFTIPCTIWNAIFARALCDLGASINLMPLSIFRRLGLGEARPTTVTLQLADKSLKHPRGVIEDVLVKVNKFIFPADFIVLDMEEDK